MNGNIIGEPIVEAIDKQINFRQQVHGAGYIPGTQNIQRIPEVQNYLNNRNAWIKMASGVSLSGSFAVDKLKTISSNEGNYLSTEEIESFQSTGLAKNVVLFNTTQKFDSSKNTYIKKSGVAENYNIFNNKMYGGLGGSSRGLQPVPGIIDISIDCVNRGSIRKATVKLKAYNKFQFGLIELLYLRLGYMVMLEWGWDKYIDEIIPSTATLAPPTVKIENMKSTIIENQWFDGNTYTQSDMINLVLANEERFKGNYGGFFGKVSNFQWSLNSDNTYDITLNLITLGSVIESLNIKIPENNIDKQTILARQKALAPELDVESNEEAIADSDNVILTNVGSDRLNQWISNTILNFKALKEKYIRSKDYIFGKDLIGVENPTQSGTTYKYTWEQLIPKESRFFVRFETFLLKLQQLAIVNVINGPKSADSELDFELDPETVRCNYETNLVPLNANKVIFSVLMSEDYEKAINSTSGMNSFSTEKGRPLSYMNANMAKFATTQNDVVYGKLLNCYLNLDFIQKSFVDAQNDKGEVGLFEFLQKLLNGINESMGNCTNLEIVIKKDKTIVIIDQNQIKGGDGLVEGIAKKTAINIYGYDSDGSSSFVKDFDFKTKITPDLMNMVTIGSTASDDKDINAIPFKLWNEGLVNRFGNSQQYDQNQQEELTLEEKTEKEFKTAFKNAIENNEASYKSGVGYVFTYGDVKIEGVWAEGVTWISDREADARNQKLLSEGLNKYKIALRKYNNDWKVGDPNAKIVKDIKEAENNYLGYLTKAFGGDSGFRLGNRYKIGNDTDSEYRISTTRIDYQRSKGLYFSWDNSDFIQQGKNAFRKYLSKINKAEAALSTPIVSGTGFLPLELGITMDGISGIKIYNRLKINTKFLPSSYPKNLKFIVKGVNHKISNNVWDTEVSTISIPISGEPPAKTREEDTNSAVNNAVTDVISFSIVSKYPELPLIEVPDSNLLPYSEAVSTLNSITSPKIAKAVFAVMFAEARRNPERTAFVSAGGYNYAGVQTDNARWGGGASDYINARFQRIDSGGVAREFASFNSNKEFLQFMANRISGKGFDGNDGDKWTNTYIQNWWSPSVKLDIFKNSGVFLFGYGGKTGGQVYNDKKAIYNSAIKRYFKFSPKVIV